MKLYAWFYSSSKVVPSYLLLDCNFPAEKRSFLQGYWPESLLTPPDDGAIERDLRQIKAGKIPTCLLLDGPYARKVISCVCKYFCISPRFTKVIPRAIKHSADDVITWWSLVVALLLCDPFGGWSYLAFVQWWWCLGVGVVFACLGVVLVCLAVVVCFWLVVWCSGVVVVFLFLDNAWHHHRHHQHQITIRSPNAAEEHHHTKIHNQNNSLDNNRHTKAPLQESRKQDTHNNTHHHHRERSGTDPKTHHKATAQRLSIAKILCTVYYDLIV